MPLPAFAGVGNLVRDPELRFTTKGDACCTFDIACSERKRLDDGTWEDTAVTYIKITTWRQLAENCSESLQKGNTVVVLGKLRSKSHEGNDGVKKTFFEVDANDVAISLNRGTVSFSRTVKPSVDVDPWLAPAEPPF